MEISAESVELIVDATRKALQIDASIRSMFNSKYGESLPENIAGCLLDVLSEVVCETLEPSQDFRKDSKVYRLVVNETISCEQVALVLEKMSKQNVRLPPPKFYSRQEIENFLDTNGGYAADYGYFAPKGENVDDIG